MTARANASDLMVFVLLWVSPCPVSVPWCALVGVSGVFLKAGHLRPHIRRSKAFLKGLTKPDEALKQPCKALYTGPQSTIVLQPDAFSNFYGSLCFLGLSRPFKQGHGGARGIRLRV